MHVLTRFKNLFCFTLLCIVLYCIVLPKWRINFIISEMVRNHIFDRPTPLAPGFGDPKAKRQLS